MNDEVKCIPIGVGAHYWAQTESGDWHETINRGEIQYLIVWSYLNEIEHGMERIFKEA